MDSSYRKSSLPSYSVFRGVINDFSFYHGKETLTNQ